MLLPAASARFSGRVHQDARHVDALEQRVERVRARHGFDDDRPRFVAYRATPVAEPSQLRLAI